jgi:hypothetical protein
MRTRGKRKRRKTRRGGTPLNIHNLVQEIQQDGFSGRVESILDNGPFSEDEDIIGDVRFYLDRFNTKVAGILQAHTVDIQTLQEDIMDDLIDMKEHVQELTECHEREDLEREIEQEIAFMNVMFGQIRNTQQ